MRILVTRPIDDAQTLAEQLHRLGHQAVIAPLMTVRYRPIPDLERVLDRAQRVLLTSANGARALARATDRRDLKLATVGRATAEAAKRAGFTRIDVAGGDADRLAELCANSYRPEDGPLAHIAGSVVTGRLGEQLGALGFTVERRVGYDAAAIGELPPPVAEGLAQGQLPVVMLFSPRTARLFLDEIERLGIGASFCRIDALCLSPAVAEMAAGLPWRRLLVAAEPAGDAMLALLDQAGPNSQAPNPQAAPPQSATPQG
jgi:uroporphyrinogen-III synthase